MGESGESLLLTRSNNLPLTLYIVFMSSQHSLHIDVLVTFFSILLTVFPARLMAAENIDTDWSTLGLLTRAHTSPPLKMSQTRSAIGRLVPTMLPDCLERS